MKYFRSENIQHLPYFWNTKTLVGVFFSVFHFVLHYFVPYECPGVCRHRPGDSLGKILKYHEMENDKKYIVNGFS